VVPVSTKVAKLIARIVLLENIAMVKLTQPALHALATHTLQQEHQSVPVAQPVSTVVVEDATTAQKVKPVQLEALVPTVPLEDTTLIRAPSRASNVLVVLTRLLLAQRLAPNVGITTTTHTLATVSAIRAVQAISLPLKVPLNVLAVLQAGTQQPETHVAVARQVSTPKRQHLRALAVQQARMQAVELLTIVLPVLRARIKVRLARQSA
jgi:hypothetical protein